MDTPKKYPDTISNLTQKERERIINQMPKQALVDVLAELTTGFRSHTIYTILIVHSFIHLVNRFSRLQKSYKTLKPRVANVKNPRKNQPLIKRWNRLLNEMESGYKDHEELKNHPSLGFVKNETNEKTQP